MDTRLLIPCMIALAIAAAGVVCEPAQAATTAEKTLAVERGLTWLAQHQYGDGHWPDDSGYYAVATTAGAVQTFINCGFEPGDDVVVNGVHYGDVVGKGLGYLFANATFIAISPQQYGNPDTNGNGLGILFRYPGTNNYDIMTTGLALTAIVAVNTPNAIVTSGPLAGRTHAQIVQDTIDYLAYGQEDGTSPMRGGWRYWANFGSSDQSCTPWAAHGLIAARQWGIEAPAFVETQLESFIYYIQPVSGDGGAWYMYNSGPSNVYRTGELLSEFRCVGEDRNNSNVQRALTFLNTRWQTTGIDGNFGNYGGMYAVFRGLEHIVGLDDNTAITNLHSPGNLDPGQTWNWAQDLTHSLVTTQYADGHWNPYGYFPTVLGTCWNIEMIQATLFSTVSGTVSYTPYGIEGAFLLTSATVNLMQDGSVVQTKVLTFDGSGTDPQPYSFTVATAGSYDVVIDPDVLTGWFGASATVSAVLGSTVTADLDLQHALPGDADMDGQCWDSDVDVVNGCYGIVDGTAVWCIGDFDNNGWVFDSDVDILNGCYGLGHVE